MNPNPDHFVIITREHLHRLAEAAIQTANPATHLACDGVIELRARINQKLGERHARSVSRKQ